MSKKDKDVEEYYKTFNFKNVKNKNNIKDELVAQIFSNKREKTIPKMDKAIPNYIQQTDLLYLPDDNGFKYLLVVVDVGSRLTDAEPMKNRQAKDVVNAIKKIYKRKILNIPVKIRCDLGSEFKGDFDVYCKENDIYISRAVAGRHRQVGLVESRNKSIGTYLMKRMVAEELTTGERVVDYLKPYITKLNDRFEDTTEYKETEFTPSCTGSNCKLLDVGDKVRYKLDRPLDVITRKPIDSKFRASDPRFSLDVHKIEKVILKSDQPLYKLEGIKPWYSMDQLIVVDDETKLPPATTQTKFIVERILEKQIVKNKIHYKVKWKNYDETTLEPRTKLIIDVPELIKEFEKNNKK